MRCAETGFYNLLFRMRMCRNVQFEIIRGGGLRPPQKAKITVTLKYSQLRTTVAAEAGDLRHG